MTIFLFFVFINILWVTSKIRFRGYKQNSLAGKRINKILLQENEVYIRISNNIKFNINDNIQQVYFVYLPQAVYLLKNTLQISVCSFSPLQSWWGWRNGTRWVKFSLLRIFRGFKLSRVALRLRFGRYKVSRMPKRIEKLRKFVPAKVDTNEVGMCNDPLKITLLNY